MVLVKPWRPFALAFGENGCTRDPSSICLYAIPTMRYKSTMGLVIDKRPKKVRGKEQCIAAVQTFHSVYPGLSVR